MKQNFEEGSKEQLGYCLEPSDCQTTIWFWLILVGINIGKWFAALFYKYRDELSWMEALVKTFIKR